MNIEFIKAERNSLTEVLVTYKLDDCEFTVYWECDEDDENGFYLTNHVEAETNSLTFLYKVLKAIEKGEDDNNEYIELYLFIRDTFDSNDCRNKELDISDYSVTDTQLFISDGQDDEAEQLYYSINYAIDDSFLIQYDCKTGFSIPSSDQAKWGSVVLQDLAFNSISAKELSNILKLPDNLKELFKNYTPDIFGDKDKRAESLLKMAIDNI